MTSPKTHNQIDNGALINGPVTLAGEYLYTYRQPDALDRGSYILADLRRLIAEGLLVGHDPAQVPLLNVHESLEDAAEALGVAIDAMAKAAKATLPYPVQLEVTAVPDGSVILSGRWATILKSDLPINALQIEDIRSLLIGQSVDLGGNGTPRSKVTRVAHARQLADCWDSGLPADTVDLIEERRWAATWSAAYLPEDHVLTVMDSAGNTDTPETVQPQNMDPAQFVSNRDGEGGVEFNPAVLDHRG